MAEAELHKERLQALAEKRKRQTEIEDKRRQLDDLVLQLQHLKSKAMRERWLLQDTPAGPYEEDDVRRRQVEQDELLAKKLEDTIHRLESDISLLENEELRISVKEQVLRDRLRETESSIEDLQKSLQNQDGDEVNPIRSQIPKVPELNSQTLAMASGDCHTRKPALYAMEINVEKNNKTGDSKILSASRISPEQAHQRGVKVYDDGQKVIYEVHSGSSTTLENGMHPWSSDEVEELMQRVGQARQRSEGARIVVTPADISIREQSSMPKDVKLNMEEHQNYKAEMTQAQEHQNYSSEKTRGNQSSVSEMTKVPNPTVDKPVTMIFMGYQNVNDDDDETKKLLGFDGTIKAEIVLIDEDDEKSLREKTVTDISTVDGNAADLVSGRPASEATELSSEGKDESSSKDPPPPTGNEKARCVLLTTENGLFPEVATRLPQSPSESSWLIEDDIELRSKKSLKSVSFLDPLSVPSRDHINMELEAQGEIQLIPSMNGQNGVKNRGEALDSEVAQEILYLDEVLEANCCDPGAEIPSNGTCSPVLRAVCVDGNQPSVLVSDDSTSISHDVVVIGNKNTTYVENNIDSIKPNGHSGIMADYDRSPGEKTTIKKEARFELRALHEEKKPSKLFDTPTEKEIRVKKVRPIEEIAELERERLELIKDQAVKKNPGIAAKWWNPPQEKTLEEGLEAEPLDSLRRYEERKQKKTETSRVPQTSFKQTVSFVQPEIENKEDIKVQCIDFSAARQQFLQMEHTKKQQQHTKRSVAPQIYSAKPFTRTSDVDRSSSSFTVTNDGRVTVEDGGKNTQFKIESDFFSTGISPVDVKNDDFTCARAVMTILKDEDSDLQQQYMNSSYHPEEIDSGLDDLSLRSQDTTVLETLSNEFSMDNISDSGASNEAMSAYLENSLGDCSFPSTPMATTPINGKPGAITKSPGERNYFYQPDSLTDDELEYHAGILVQNAIQQAIAHQNNQWEPLQAMQQSSPIPERHVEILEPLPEVHEERSRYVPPPKESFSVEEKTSSSKITPQFPTIQTTSTVTVNTYRPQSTSPPPNVKPEYSYFSKYSEAAELRSTATVTRAQEPEITSGPFKLRSRKQRTLSMIEEEIRAAQEREEELRRERQAQIVHPSINPIHKQRTNSLPAKLVLTGKTAPGKIEKIRAAPPVSPASSDGALPSPLSDLGSDDSGGSQRPKNFMQTLMEDYETHKVRRREKSEDNSVLEATRVTRRKSNMALRWEAGIYANQEEGEEEEEE